jgi:hypothetical protein
MASIVISQGKTTKGNASPPRTREQAGGLSTGGTESSVWATRGSRMRPRDERARRAPGGWGTRLEQSTAPGPMSVFGPVRPLDVRSLAGPVVDVEVPAGTELVREGIPVGTFFVIRDGSAEVFRDGRHVGSLTIGDCFGEVDPESGGPQAYSVITSSQARLLTFSSFGISRLCEAIPGVRDRILQRLPRATAELHWLSEAGVRSRGAAAAAAAR